MRTTLGTRPGLRPAVSSLLPALGLALTLTLPACGETTSETGSDTSSPSPDARWEQVALLTESATGGSTSTGTVRLSTEADVDEFLTGMEGGEIEAGVRDAFANEHLGPGEHLYAAVVALGCDTPKGVAAEIEGDRVTVVPVGLVKTDVQCFAAVTSVGIVKADVG